MTSGTGGALNIFLFASVFLVSFFFFPRVYCCRDVLWAIN